MRSIDLRGFSGWLESLRRSYVPDDDDLDPLQKFARSLHFAWPTLGPEQRVLQRLQQLCKLKAVAQTLLSYGDHLRGVAEPSADDPLEGMARAYYGEMLRERRTPWIGALAEVQDGTTNFWGFWANFWG